MGRLASYAVTGWRNSESESWRGKLRGYAVTDGPYTCAGAQVRVHVRPRACVRQECCNRVTA